MAAQLLEGKPVAEAVLGDLGERIGKLSAAGKSVGLGTILVGDDPASAGYVRMKHEACARLGIESFHHQVPASASQADLLAAVDEFNRDQGVDAFLVQNPVPSGFDFNEAMLRMDPAKDVDGLHPVNLGRLVLQAEGPVPCTPAGILALLSHYGITVAGREVVVVGRGPTLGRPLSLMLTLKRADANAAVTVVHTGVADIGAFTRRADVVVAAVGVPGFVTPDMVKPGAVVISGGITYEGRKVLADVDERVGEVASWITPRIGGVGPITIAMLLKNCVEAAERAGTPA
jgi:methylenetetrahydrofolate dehydrogenase (NADP+)/methenyltetrahydrofolate cyclohydrolase